MAFIKQLSNQKFKDYKVVVVNNGSNNFERLQHSIELLPEAVLVNPNENKGYLGGANFGLNAFLKLPSDMPDKVIVCNTDIDFPTDSFLDSVSQLKADIIGPAIISSQTKADQNPFYSNRISLSKLRFLKVVFSVYLFYLMYQTLALAKNLFKRNAITQQITKPQNVYAIHGSFMIFNKSCFVKGMSFNYGSFLYGEEIYIAEIGRNNNMIVQYNPALQVIHNEHSTTGTYKKPQHIKFMSQSIKYLIKKYFS